MGTDLKVYTLVSIREAEPLWSDETIAKAEANARDLGQKVSGIRWPDGVSSVVRWRGSWERPAWDDLVTAYFWGTIGRENTRLADA